MSHEPSAKQFVGAWFIKPALINHQPPVIITKKKFSVNL